MLPHVTFTFVQGDHRRDFRLYPINALRNIGIRAVQTSTLFVIDADFIPDPGLYDAVQRVAVPEISRDHLRAFVVASPGLRMSSPNCSPRDINALRTLFEQGTPC